MRSLTVYLDTVTYKNLHCGKTKYFYNKDGPIIYISNMCNHYFISDKCKINIDYFKFRDDEKLDEKRKTLVERLQSRERNGKIYHFLRS